ncbi:retrovirus-related pol polyprotein from transposon TNT 1-94 [Tanacetum coccineum]
MEVAVQQSSVDKQCLEIAKKEILLENDRLLQKIMSQDVLLTVMNSMSLHNDSVNMEMQECESCEKCLNLDAELSKSKQAYNDFLKNYSQLEKHCISLEASMQLQQEVFQNNESCVNQNAVEIQEYFEINDLKARLQDKDKTICKLKDTIQSLRENTKEENVFKDQFDSIKQTRVRHKEQRKEIVENVVHTPSVTTIAPGMFKLDLVPLPPRLLKNRYAHIDYLRHTQEQANTIREIVEQAKAKQHLDSELDFACKYATRIQKLLVYVQDTYPNAITPSPKKVESSNTSDSNTPVLSSTGVKCSTSNCGSKPPGNKKNDRISQTPSRNKKNKVEAQPRKVNKMNHVVKPVCDVDVKHLLSNANSKILCATCNKSMFDGVHDKCLLDLVQNGNNRTKSSKKHKKQNIWKPTGHVFTKVVYKWKPTGRTFTIVGNSCPLTRFTSTNVVPPKQTTSHSDEKQKPEIKVYRKKPKNVKNIGYPDCTLVSGLQMFKTHNRESLSAHELSPLFLWAKAINTACYTQNRSLIRHRYNKTPYELMQDKKPNLSFFDVFGSLWYPTNDHEDLGKFDAKVGIGIFVGYAPAKKAFRIYNRRTRIISETIHVTFNELTSMAFEQFSSGPGLYFQEATAPRAEVLADSPVLTSIDQDAPSTSIPSLQEQEHSPINS